MKVFPRTPARVVVAGIPVEEASQLFALYIEAEPRFKDEEEFVNVQVPPVQFMETSAGPEVASVIAGPVAVPPAINVEVAGAERIYPGLVQEKDSAPVEVVKEIPTPLVATVKVFPRTPARVVVAGALVMYPGFVHEKESAPVDVV